MNHYWRKDVLTNMHANTTIPEVLGCAKAYEVTGEKNGCILLNNIGSVRL